MNEELFEGMQTLEAEALERAAAANDDNRGKEIGIALSIHAKNLEQAKLENAAYIEQIKIDANSTLKDKELERKDKELEIAESRIQVDKELNAERIKADKEMNDAKLHSDLELKKLDVELEKMRIESDRSVQIARSKSDLIQSCIENGAKLIISGGVIYIAVGLFKAELTGSVDNKVLSYIMKLIKL